MSFDIDWTLNDPNYTHTFDVTWWSINMCNALIMENRTTPGNNYSVMELDVTCNYNVSVAATCGMSSGPMTVYGKN